MSEVFQDRMKFALTAKRPELAQAYPKDADEHASSLMKDFDMVNRWLQENEEQYSHKQFQRYEKKVALGIKQGVALGLEEVSQGICRKVDERFVNEVVEREIAKELSKGFSRGMPTFLFDQLYKSYAELNAKLAAKDELARGYNPRSHQRLPKRLPRGSIAPRSSQNMSEKSASQDVKQVPRSDDGGMRGCQQELYEDSEDSSELSEDHCEESSDRCCICGTLSDQEEHMITTCCLKSVGAICFEEAIQETSKCCLCQKIQGQFEPGASIGQSEQELNYRFRFVETQVKAEDSRKDKSVDDITNQLEPGIARPSWESSPPPLVPGKSVEPPNHLRETSMCTARKSEACQPEDTKPLGKDSLSDLVLEPNRIPHKETLTRDAVLPLDPQENDPGTLPITKQYEFVLRLFDQAVISYLERLSEKGLLDTVEEALGGLLSPTIRTKTVLEVSRLESGAIELKYGLVEGRAIGLEQSAKNLTQTLENFVRARLQPYLVVMHKVETKTMDLSNKVQKTRAIEELVRFNASTMQFLRRPDDIRFIRWTWDEKSLHTAKMGSVTIALATAAHANEVIARGLLWKGERRYCMKQGLKRRLVQCDECQAFGHIAEACTSSPRCQTCAEGHQSKDCPLGPNASPKSLKCALCGSRHSARYYHCTVKRSEEIRLRLENHVYPTDADNVAAASARLETKSPPLLPLSKTPLLVTPSPNNVEESIVFKGRQ